MRHISVAIVLLACADSALAGECSLPPARLVGNRELHVDRSGAVTAYTLANPANEYATVGGQSVQYDAAGNLVVDEDGRQYDYDSQNRLIAVRDAGMQTLATYMYDALGRRIVSDIDGVVTRFYHDGVSVIEERDAGDVRLRYHINGAQYIDERVARFDEGRGEHTYYLLNRDYSVAATGDASGASIVRQDFSALGDFTEPPRGYYFDADLDNDIDIADYAAFYGCMAGPGVSVSGSCALHDFERNDDVDLRDFKYFQMSYAGSREEPPQFARLDVTYYHDANGDRVVDLDDYYSSFYECVADADAMCLAVHDFDALGVSDGEVGPADLAGFITCQDEAFGPEPCMRSEFDGTTPASGSFTLHGRQIDVLPDGKILTYIRARYYDPEMGRWLQRDPIGYADGANLYEAFGGNAARSSDPMGTELGDWWDPRTYLTLGEAWNDVYIRPLSDAVFEQHRETAGAEVLGHWTSLVILVEELPAQQMIAREASIAALEGREVQYGIGHMACAWATHHAGFDAMTDALNRFDLTNRRSLSSVESVSLFSSGLSSYTIGAAIGVGTGQLAGQLGRSAAVTRAALQSGRPLGHSLRLGLRFSRPYVVPPRATRPASSGSEIAAPLDSAGGVNGASGRQLLLFEDLFESSAENVGLRPYRGPGGASPNSGQSATLVGDAARASNLNAKNAVSHFGVYEIHVNGTIYKVGKADLARITKSSGLPTRLHQQLRVLRKQFGRENVTGRVVEDLGEVTTETAKRAEHARILRYYEDAYVPVGNRKSFKP